MIQPRQDVENLEADKELSYRNLLSQITHFSGSY